MTKDNFGISNPLENKIQKIFNTPDEAVTHLLAKKLNLKFCLNCGKNRVYDANPICSKCIKDLKQKDIDALVEDAINAWINRESSK